MPHEHLSFDSFNRFKGDTDKNEYRCTSDSQTGKTVDVAHHLGQKSDKAQEDCAHKSDLVEDSCDKLCCGSARTEAGDKSAVFTDVIGDLYRIELNRRIEVCETYDEECIYDHIGNCALGEGLCEIAPERTFSRLQELDDRCGNCYYGRGKDDGHNAGHIYLHRNVCRLSAVYLSSDNTLCILNRYAALSVGDKYNESYDSHSDYKYYQKREYVEVAVYKGRYYRYDSLGTAAYDRGEEDKGNTVSYALFCDLFAEPHDKRRTSCEGYEDNYHGDGVCSCESARALEHDIICVAQDEGETDRHITGDGGQFLFAFLAAVFYHSLKGGYSYLQEVHDNRGVDIRIDRKSEYRCLAEAAAGQYIEVSEDSVAVLFKYGLYHVEIYIGNIDRITETVYNQSKDNKEKFFSKIRNSPRVSKCLYHITRPPRFLRRLLSSLLPRQ